MSQLFSYKVMDRAGKVSLGELEAESEFLVNQKLRESGFVILEIKSKAQSLANTDLGAYFERFQKVTGRDLMIFSRQLAMMINAGLPILKALIILAEQTENPKLQKIVMQVREDVTAGATFSEALGKFTDVFSMLYVSMVKSGEIGGALDKVLLRLAEVIEKEQALKAKVKSAMTYPVAIMAFALVVVTGMIIGIVPVFADMYGKLGGSLPAPTKALMIMSDVLKNYWYMIFGGGIGAFYGLRKYKKTEKGRKNWDKLMLKVKLIGPIIQKASIARLTRTLGTLVSSGVPIIQAVEITGKASGNAVIEEAMETVCSSIREGDSIARPLLGLPVFPPMVTQMISVGEETGALDAMLEKIADFYDTEVEAAVESLTSMLEPLSMVVIGTMIGGIMISLYMPMFQLISLIK